MATQAVTIFVWKLDIKTRCKTFAEQEKSNREISQIAGLLVKHGYRDGMSEHSCLDTEKLGAIEAVAGRSEKYGE